MKIKLLFIQDGEYNRKLRQVKLIKELFGLALKEAKDAVDSGEFIPQCDCILKSYRKYPQGYRFVFKK